MHILLLDLLLLRNYFTLQLIDRFLFRPINYMNFRLINEALILLLFNSFHELFNFAVCVFNIFLQSLILLLNSISIHCQILDLIIFLRYYIFQSFHITRFALNFLFILHVLNHQIFYSIFVIVLIIRHIRH